MCLSLQSSTIVHMNHIIFNCWRDLEVTSASGLLANCTLLTSSSCEILIEFKSLFRKLISINSTFLSKIKMMPSLKVKRTLISVNDSHQLKMTLLCANQVCRKKSITFDYVERSDLTKCSLLFSYKLSMF